MDIRLQLQIKRDPKSYKTLYKNEVDKLRGMIKISKLDPEAKNSELSTLLTFLPHISKHYDEDIAGDIFNYALDYYSLLERSLSQSVITGITTLKKTKQIGPEIFYKQSIPLIEEMDKRTKTVFIQFLIAEIIRDNTEHRKLIQEILINTIHSGVESHSKRAVYLFMHLVSREVWVDKESSEMVFEMIFQAPPVVINFVFMYLLDRVKLVVTEEEIEVPVVKKTDSKIKKETRGDKKKKERKEKERKKKEEEKKEKEERKEPNIIALLNRLGDKGPYYGSKLFKKVKASEYSPDTKLMMVQIVSRIISFYTINIKGFHGYMMRFLFPHQEKLPSVFSAIAQAIHQETPSREVEAVCELIVENFCSDYKDDDIIAYGVNSLRAIIRRYPEAAQFECIKKVMDYRRLKKKRAVTASSALKKMIRDIEKAKEKENNEEAENIAKSSKKNSSGDKENDEMADDDGDESGYEMASDEGSFDADASDDEESLSADDSSFSGDETDDDSNGFVTEEMISKIRKKDTKEEKIEKAKADKRERKKKEQASTNKEKQKVKNYTVRKTKRKAIPKKRTKKTKR
ncbi:protein SDA1 [Nematocida minor]|uniref:protein SDA1 n=1 Tax=Nematocida minor TaxID=1912983 RepID=UPI0022207319|nr:protein SDA1 [Nematocida minor]KAI5189141.1 protein SDA1 [Nematocida minor]